MSEQWRNCVGPVVAVDLETSQNSAICERTRELHLMKMERIFRPLSLKDRIQI